ncbi:MAG: peptide MFS transporter [Candidatus Solibacter sp.]
MATPTDHAATLAAIRADKSFFGHPRGLATLFFTEMWERFSYYGMRAILIYYLTTSVAKGGLGFADSKAGAVYGLYASMVYLMCLAGGWVADRVVGQRRAVLMGGVLIAAGEFCLVMPAVASFYLGLVLLVCGTGLLKGNVSTIVGQLYAPGDPRRDSGFSIFYMGINIGALISPLICGWIGEHYGWRMGFGVAGLAMLAGLVQYLLTSRHLGSAGLHPASTGDLARDLREKKSAIRALVIGGAVVALLAALSTTGIVEIDATMLSNAQGWLLLGISAVVFSWLIFFGDWTPIERKRSAAILVLFVSSALFWAAFEQAGSSLSLFADRGTDCQIFGFVFPASWFQSVQPVFVVTLAPVFAWIWLAMGRREPSSPGKFSLGLLFGGLAFLILVPAAYTVAAGGKVGPYWLIVTYFLQTLGELCLSPVGLSSMTKLAPERAAGFMMGIWFLSTSIGNWLAGQAASVYSSMPLPTLFGAVAAFSILAAVALFILIKPTVRMMQGVK